MPIFRYKARNKKGKIKTGIDIGLNETDIVSRFRRKELEIISLSPADFKTNHPAKFPNE